MATEIVKGYKKLPYPRRDHVKKLRIYSIHGKDENTRWLIQNRPLVTGPLRGHSLKLFKPGRHTTVRRKFFSSQIVIILSTNGSWNKKPELIV